MTFFAFFFYLNFCWTKAHFVEPLVAPVLDFVSFLMGFSFLVVCGDPKGQN